MNTPAEPTPSPGAELLRGRLMQRSLRVLLDQVRGSREALPHLAALEAALGGRGTAAIELIPVQFIGKVFRQLRVLPLPDDDAALQDLIVRLQRAMRQGRPASTYQLSPFDPEATVVITEGSHSDFMDALDQARSPLPGVGV